MSTSTRPRLTAEHRTITGKQVATLRRQGILPAVVYGHGHDSESIQIDAKEFETLRRKTGRNAILDLKVGSARVTPVILQQVAIDPVQRTPIHADFFVVKMSEEMVVDVPIAKGHVILFSNNPIWRGETHGSYFMVLNAILNHDNLDAGRKLDQR